MTEAESDGPEPTSSDVERIPSMTFWEKVGFSFLPIFMVPFMPIAALFFFSFTFAFLRDPYLFKRESQEFLKQGTPLLVFTVVSCAIFGAILVYPVQFFRKMRIRKRTTRSLFPSGGELVALRYRRKHPPAWMKIYVVSFLCLIAFGVTYKTIVPPAHHPYAAWGVVGLFWLIAIAAAVDATWPRQERLWTGFVFSGAFGILAIVLAIGIIRSGHQKAWYWLYPLLFALISGFLGAATIRDKRKRMCGAPVNQAPSI
jgi:hypothetical protein